MKSITYKLLSNLRSKISVQEESKLYRFIAAVFLIAVFGFFIILVWVIGPLAGK